MPTSRSSSKAPSTPALEDQERGPHWRTLLLPDAPAAAVNVGDAAPPEQVKVAEADDNQSLPR